MNRRPDLDKRNYCCDRTLALLTLQACADPISPPLEGSIKLTGEGTAPSNDATRESNLPRSPESDLSAVPGLLWASNGTICAVQTLECAMPIRVCASEVTTSVS